MAELSFMQPIRDRTPHRVVVPFEAQGVDEEGLVTTVRKVNQTVWQGRGRPPADVMATARETALNPPVDEITNEFGGDIVALRGNISIQKQRAIKIGGKVLAEWWRTTRSIHATELDAEGRRLNPNHPPH